LDWKKLQNGSAIRGIAIEGVEGENVNLTPAVVHRLGQAFVVWLKKQITPPEHLSVAVGIDARLSGKSLKKAFLAGVCTKGAIAFDCGMASTPALFMSTVDPGRSVTAGVMITASHLPFNQNGLKFFTKNGSVNKRGVSKILEIAEELAIIEMGTLEWQKETRQLQQNNLLCLPYSLEQQKKYPIKQWDFLSTYTEKLVHYIRQGVAAENYLQPLSGLHIVVDAGNGAGGFFVSKILEPLGAITTGSQFLKPDGSFPHHNPNPKDVEAIAEVAKIVKEQQADMGILLNGDVNRSALVDRQGNLIHKNKLIALIGSIVLKEHPESTIVTDSITSDGLHWFIEHNLKGKHRRFKRGYKNVINESIRLNVMGRESWLAIDTSGHVALKENYFLDDGIYLIVKLLIEAACLKKEGKELAVLLEKLKEPAESKKMRFTITTEQFRDYGKQVLNELSQTIALEKEWEIEQPNEEGIRIRCKKAEEQGWFLLRLSPQSNRMPLDIESEVKGGVQKITQHLLPLLADFKNLQMPTA